MRAAGVIIPFSTPISSSHIEQVPEPAHVQALVAQLFVEAFHTSVLGRFARVNVNQIDLPLVAFVEETSRVKNSQPTWSFHLTIISPWSMV